MERVLVTGSQGFIASYICNELLANNYTVFGVDNYSKYGRVIRSHDNHRNFRLFIQDIADKSFFQLVKDIEPHYIIATAAIIGGIVLFHRKAYDLLAANERILASTFDAAIHGWQQGYLKRIIVLSSSMIFENASIYPTPENAFRECPPPLSTYGAQKLMAHYFCQGAWEQYGLPWTCLMPFNVVGVGEDKTLEEKNEGNAKMMSSHVLPDFVNKALQKQQPFKILGDGSQVRCFTNGKDCARGVRLALGNTDAINKEFNISYPTPTTVLELAEKVWRKVNPGEPFIYECEPGLSYDVQKRIPDVSKARELLGFEAKISIDDSIDEVVEYFKERI